MEASTLVSTGSTPPAAGRLYPSTPAEVDLEAFGRLRSEVCPLCGRENLPLDIYSAGSTRYLGWSCPDCNLTGILGIYPE